MSVVSVFKRPKEPAERAASGWLRSRFTLTPYPRPNTAACGRPRCEVCGEGPIQCEALQPEPTEEERNITPAPSELKIQEVKS